MLLWWKYVFTANCWNFWIVFSLQYIRTQLLVLLIIQVFQTQPTYQVFYQLTIQHIHLVIHLIHLYPPIILAIYPPQPNQLINQANVLLNTHLKIHLFPLLHFYPVKFHQWFQVILFLDQPNWLTKSAGKYFIHEIFDT